MKRIPVPVLLLLAACGAPAANPTGQQAPTVVTPLMLEPPPVYALIGSRERLQLTSEQIVRLDSIAEAVRQRNAQLLSDLRTRAEPTRSQTALVVGDSARPVLEQIRANNQEAAAAVGQALSAEQQTTVCQLFDMEREDQTSAQRDRARAEERDREEEERRARRRNPMGIELDTALIMMQRRVWPWCSATAPRRGGRDAGN